MNVHRVTRAVMLFSALLTIAAVPVSDAAAQQCRVEGAYATVANLASDGEVEQAHRYRLGDPECREPTNDLPLGVAILHRADGRLVEASRIPSDATTVRTEVRVHDMTAASETIVVQGPHGVERVDTTLTLPMMTVITVTYPAGWSVRAPSMTGVTVHAESRSTTVRYARLLFSPITPEQAQFVVDATPARGVPSVRVEAAPIGHVDNLGVPEGLLSTDDYAVIAAFTQLAYDGALELVDGTEELAEGTRELADGTAELADGTRELADGMAEFADGITEVAEAMPELVEGADEVADGTQELLDGLIELVDGLDAFETQLDNVATGSDGLAQALDQLATVYELTSATLAAEPQLQPLHGVLEALFAPTSPGQDPIDESASQLASGLRAMADAMDDLVDDLRADDGLLDGVGQLADGTEEFAEGISELADGLRELADAARELEDGTGELADGTDELADGTRELADGVDELAEGVAEFPDLLTEIQGFADRANLERATQAALLQAGADRAAQSSMVTVELIARGMHPVHPAVPVGIGGAVVAAAGIALFSRRLLAALTRKFGLAEGAHRD